MTKPKQDWVHPSRLRPNPWNTNAVGPDNERKLSASLDQLGQFKPVIVRYLPDGQTDYEILGGEHRWRELSEQGAETIWIADLGELDDDKAKKISLADNARYGVDDTVELAKLLKELGGAEIVQEILPYSDAELTTIFSSEDIAIDELEIADSFEGSDPGAPGETPASKAPKTHTIMRFKVPLGDAEWITKRIVKIQKKHGFTAADELTNAGDALVHLLSGKDEGGES